MHGEKSEPLGPDRDRRLLITVFVIAAAAGYFFFIFGSYPLVNLWLLTSNRGEYVIPQESSILTFQPTVMNQGSGGWWIYGDDDKNYYFHEGEPLARELAESCKGFNSLMYETWSRCRTKR